MAVPKIATEVVQGSIVQSRAGKGCAMSKYFILAAVFATFGFTS